MESLNSQLMAIFVAAITSAVGILVVLALAELRKYIAVKTKKAKECALVMDQIPVATKKTLDQNLNDLNFTKQL